MTLEKILNQLDHEIKQHEAVALALEAYEHKGIMQGHLDAIKALEAARALIAHISALAATA